MSVMQRLSDAIAQTDGSIAIGSAGWVIPTVQSIHILAIAIVMSATAMLNLRLAGFIGSDSSVRQLANRSLPWLWWSLPVLLATGLVMILGEPARELTNAFFWSKMAHGSAGLGPHPWASAVARRLSLSRNGAGETQRHSRNLARVAGPLARNHLLRALDRVLLTTASRELWRWLSTKAWRGSRRNRLQWQSQSRGGCFLPSRSCMSSL